MRMMLTPFEISRVDVQEMLGFIDVSEAARREEAVKHCRLPYPQKKMRRRIVWR
jgi:hypothetical protein